MKYCRNIKFDEEPDYKYIIDQFKEVFESKKYVYDDIYEWNTHVSVTERASTFLHLANRQHQYEKINTQRKISGDLGQENLYSNEVCAPQTNNKNFLSLSYEPRNPNLKGKEMDLSNRHITLEGGKSPTSFQLEGYRTPRNSQLEFNRRMDNTGVNPELMRKAIEDNKKKKCSCLLL